MIAYTVLGTNDLPRALAFYDALFAVIGAKRLMDFGDRGACWGREWGPPSFGVMTPFDGQPATRGNGTMIAVACRSAEEVAALHAKALELGGSDEGAPGPRNNPQFHCGYFRDLDGNKINAFAMLQA